MEYIEDNEIEKVKCNRCSKECETIIKNKEERENFICDPCIFEMIGV